MTEILAVARQMLGDLQKSPYANRIFTVVDSVHGPSVLQKIQSMGVPAENAVVWDNNGIEHLYPRSILEEVFGVFVSLSIDDDNISANGVTKRKGELSKIVSARLREDTPVPDELQTKLFAKVEALLN